ncbi:anti-sigma factor domain-containing protein [Ferruginibacter sp.]
MDIKEYISSGIIEMYVMDICSGEERTELERMCTQYPEVKNALHEFERNFETIMLQHPTEPGNTTDEKILASLRSLQPAAPVITMQSVQQVPVRKMNWLRPVAAAAVLLLLVSGYYNFNMYQKMHSQELALAQKDTAIKTASLPENDYAVLKNPAITPVAMYGVAPYTLCRCTMYWDKKTGKAYIMIHHLIPSPDNKKYQLWAMVNDKPVNVGMVHDEIRDHFIELENVPGDATAFSVTLEDIGNNKTPTTSNMFLYGRI